LSSGAAADAAVAMVVAATIPWGERECGGVDDATRCGSAVGLGVRDGPLERHRWAGNRIPVRDWFRGYPIPVKVYMRVRP
jgi:hypothetical protein